jgi:CRISPR-associated protein Csb2
VNSPSRLDLRAFPAIVRRWREAVLAGSSGLSDPVRALLSGHDSGGARIDAPHLAFLPLAPTDGPDAGRLPGAAPVLPAGIPAADARRALAEVVAVPHLALGRLGLWRVVPAPVAGTFDQTLDAWTAQPGGATEWSTITPIAFDRHPKADSRAKSQEEIARMIAAACERIGLPEPRAVVASAVSAHPGVPPAFEFPRLQRKDGSDRRHAHATLVFDRPVRGPILVGAGRFRGYGCCRPLDWGERKT